MHKDEKICGSCCSSEFYLNIFAAYVSVVSSCFSNDLSCRCGFREIRICLKIRTSRYVILNVLLLVDLTAPAPAKCRPPTFRLENINYSIKCCLGRQTPT